MKKQFGFCIIYLAVLILSACNNGPKIIEVDDSATTSNSEMNRTGIFSESGSVPQKSNAPNVKGGVHTVKALEVLPTDKYVYIRVEEDGEEFWIATAKMEVDIGQNYLYKSGILKTNFESKEYNRVFDKVYLVSNIVPANHGGSSTATSSNENESQSGKTISKEIDLSKIKAEGSISIAELVENPGKYEGQKVQLSGLCEKLNPNIMGRNWIHLKDGTKDDYDLVLTSDLAVPEGHVVTMEGTVILNKDFGAGYKYDILVEDAKIVNP